MRGCSRSSTSSSDEGELLSRLLNRRRADFVLSDSSAQTEPSKPARGPRSKGRTSLAVYNLDSVDETSFTAPPAAEDDGFGVEGLLIQSVCSGSRCSIQADPLALTTAIPLPPLAPLPVTLRFLPLALSCLSQPTHLAPSSPLRPKPPSPSVDASPSRSSTLTLTRAPTLIMTSRSRVRLNLRRANRRSTRSPWTTRTTRSLRRSLQRLRQTSSSSLSRQRGRWEGRQFAGGRRVRRPSSTCSTRRIQMTAYWCSGSR